MKREIYNLYDAEEFDSWAAAAGLDPQEHHLFDRYLFDRPKDLRILDAGTGAGKFLFALSQHGFRRLTGVDMSRRLIEVARAKCASIGAEDHMSFFLQSVCALSFEDESQDAVIALQQLPSLIEDPADRIQALREMYRVLVPGGVILACFLSWEGRWFNPLLAAVIFPLKILKREFNRLRKNYLCFIKLNDRLNTSYLYTQQPYAYWFTRREVEQRLREAGFEILELATSGMLIGQQRSCGSKAVIYVVAKKPGVVDR
ncbi:MAG: class I SAM-dependent methyltransferase [Verrucomicrobiota bacterium]|nr:class I SAM-dependent methyltransferase [Verrucomicrobiota bacterium]